MDNHQFINDFVQEALGNLDKVELGLLKLNESSKDKNTINEIFRAVHSIKGTSGFFGFKNIVKLSHEMENVLGAVRNGSMHIDENKIDILLKCNDCLKLMVSDSSESENVHIEQIVQDLNRIFSNKLSIDEEKTADIVDEFDNVIKIKGEELNLLENGVKHGHKIYSLNINETQGKDSEITSKIKSIGTIINIFNNQQNIKGYVFLFTTVLEKSLLELALGKHEGKIHKYTIEKDCEIIESQSSLRKNVMNKSGEGESIKEKSIIEERIEEKNVVEKNIIEDVGIKEKIVDESIRVKVSLLNDLMNLAGEMVLARNQLLRSMDKHKKNIVGIESILQHIDYNTTQIQEKIMQTRMQPVMNLFNKFPRLIRELSKDTGKNVKLILKGEQVELDKSIIQSLEDPLTHLIRNSVDHGLEKKDERLKKGKEPEGTVVIEAYNESGYVYIKVKDDGKGIDTNRIKSKILQKNLAHKEYIDKLEEKELIKYILKPGFSTSDEITDISGRGVGMDVVKTNIERLGGTIEIETEYNKSTAITLILPLTLAIMSSIIVEAEGQKYALPRANLQEMVRIKKEKLNKKIENINGHHVLRLREKILPLVYLWDILNNGSKKSERQMDIMRILIVKIGLKQFGVVVDKVCDEEEILVKPLPKYFLENKCYAGVTIMGDGNVAMILDVKGLAERSNIKY